MRVSQKSLVLDAWTALRSVSILVLAFLITTTCAIELQPEDAAENRYQQILADSRLISIWEVNEIHRRFVSRCMKDLPQEVTVQYIGRLGTDNGRLKVKVLEETESQATGLPLSWDVVRDVVVFQFWISTKRTTETVAQCQIDGRPLHVNVSFVDENRDVQAPITALGGASVKGVLQKLASPNRQPAFQKDK